MWQLYAMVAHDVIEERRREARESNRARREPAEITAPLMHSFERPVDALKLRIRNATRSA